MSIATLKTSAKALESNAFLLFVFVIFNDLLIFSVGGKCEYSPLYRQKNGGIRLRVFYIPAFSSK